MITFQVKGTPKPQGSKVLQSATINGQTKSWIREANSDVHNWRDQVKAAAKQAMTVNGQEHMFSHAVSVEILFVFKRPKSVKTRQYPNVKPDIDKLCRAVLDALTGTMITDDGRVVELFARKAYEIDNGQPEGALITVSGFDNDSITAAWDRYKKNVLPS